MVVRTGANAIWQIRLNYPCSAVMWTIATVTVAIRFNFDEADTHVRYLTLNHDEFERVFIKTAGHVTTQLTWHGSVGTLLVH